MSLLQAIVLGIVQGLTEFLPVSSTAHLILVPWLLGWPGLEEGLAFDVALHAGTLVAVVAYFRAEIVVLARAALRLVLRPDLASDAEQRLALMIVLGTLPAVAAGLLFKDAVETTLRSPLVIAGSLVAVALLILIADARGRRERELAAGTLLDALAIGCAQAVALVPGVSRSGATIAAGLGCGLTREAAATFSFLLGLPAILGGIVVEGPKILEGSGTAGTGLGPCAAGAAAAAIVGYLAIRGLLALVAHRSFLPFVVYRIALGLAVLYLTAVGGLRR